MMYASQSTGVTGISNYLIPILTSLGFENGFPLIIYAIYSTIGTVCVFIVTFTVVSSPEIRDIHRTEALSLHFPLQFPSLLSLHLLVQFLTAS